LGPSPEELWATFRLPAGTVLLGLALMVFYLVETQGTVSAGFVFGLGVVALAALLAALELRDLRRPWLSWDDDGLTWGDAKGRLRATWAEIATLQLADITMTGMPGLRRNTKQQLWLLLRPLDWAAFCDTHPDVDRYADTALPDYTIGLRASAGTRHRAWLDQRLKSIGCYAGFRPAG